MKCHGKNLNLKFQGVDWLGGFWTLPHGGSSILDLTAEPAAVTLGVRDIPQASRGVPD